MGQLFLGSLRGRVILHVAPFRASPPGNQRWRLPIALLALEVLACRPAAEFSRQLPGGSLAGG
jgi:hypothetical protein